METMFNLVNVAKYRGIDSGITDATVYLDEPTVIVGTGMPERNNLTKNIVRIDLSEMGDIHSVLVQDFLDSGAKLVSSQFSGENYGLFWANWL